MKFLRKKISKDSSRVVIHKLNSAIIKKNPNVEKEQIITKIKKHEKLYIICLAFSFVLIFLGITLLIGTSFKHFMGANVYDSGNLKVEYSQNDNNIGDVVTLYDTNIVENARIEKNESYKFSIKNEGTKSIKYQIQLVKDYDLIEIDMCREKFFKDSNIKFNVNKGRPIYLNSKKYKDYYVLVEDIIPANSTKLYTLNFWVNKQTKMEDRHFHGIIEVREVR